jgi:hypothetical protein
MPRGHNFVKDLQNRGQSSHYSLHSRNAEGGFILPQAVNNEISSHVMFIC